MEIAKIAIIIVFLIIAALVLPKLAQEKIDESINEDVVDSLESNLSGDQYAVFNSVSIPGFGSKTFIAHVIVTSFGIFVVHTKNIYGWVIGNAANDQWTYSKGRGHKASIKNPLRENKAQVKALQRYLKLPKESFIPIVAFPDRTVVRIKTDKNLIKFGELTDFILDYEDSKFTCEEKDEIAEKIAILQDK